MNTHSGRELPPLDRILETPEATRSMRLEGRGPEGELPLTPDLGNPAEGERGTWRGCVYDVERIAEVIEAGLRHLPGERSGQPPASAEGPPAARSI